MLLDCDGVLADFMGAALPIINNLLDTKHRLGDVTVFNFAEALGLSAVDAAAVKRALGRSRRLAATLAVYPGAIAGVRALRRVAEVYIVTSSWDSNETWEFDRKGWLRRHFGIRHHEICFTAAKHICAGDFLVDDKTETLEKWQAEHPRGVAVQWETLHNRLDTWSGPSTCDWAELVAMVDRRHGS